MGYEEQPSSLLKIPELKKQAIEIYSMSKAYNVAGWRVGALVGNSKIVKALSKLKAQIDYGIFLPVQMAAANTLSLDKDLTENTRNTYIKRSQFLFNGLKSLGWKLTKPDAGCSIWCELPDRFHSWGAFSYLQKLLVETGVAALPGDAFGDCYQIILGLRLFILNIN